MQLENLGAAALQFQHEIVVILLCFLHPEDVVEQKRVAIARSQPLMREARPTDHDGSEFSDFRMDAKCRFHVALATPDLRQTRSSAIRSRRFT